MTDKRFNIKASFNDDFLSTLEYHLSAAFKNAGDPEVVGLWCDGIEMPEIDEQYNSNNITSINKVVTSAWIGVTGQDRYLMTIKMGPCSRRRALKGLYLDYCLPDASSFSWVDVDVENKLINLQIL